MELLPWVALEWNSNNFGRSLDLDHHPTRHFQKQDQSV